MHFLRVWGEKKIKNAVGQQMHMLKGERNKEKYIYLHKGQGWEALRSRMSALAMAEASCQ